MSRTLTAADRTALIRLAHSLPKGSEERKTLLAGLKVASLPDGTVGTFLLVLSSKLTQYDQRATKKDGNIYRLSLLFAALQKAGKRVAKLKDEDSPEALQALKDALLREFTKDLRGRPDLPPVANVFKQIDAFLSSGKLPSLRG